MKNPRDFRAAPYFGSEKNGWVAQSAGTTYEVLKRYPTQAEAQTEADRKNALPDREVGDGGRCNRPNWLDD